MNKPVVFTLPFPPSSNSLFRNAPKPHMKRPKTKGYLSWLQSAGWQLKIQRVSAVKGPVKLTYELYNSARGPNKLWDYANREKACTDLLVEHGIIEADSQKCLRRLVMEWADINGIRITINGL